MAPPEIQVMLVDDHDIVRTSLRTFLETRADIAVIGEASNGREALDHVSEICPDVIVMDITMPEMDGLEATRRLKQMDENCKVLVLTVHDEKEHFFEMLKAGATGYVTKHAAADELVEAIHAVARGHVYLQPALARWLLEDYRRLVETPGIPRSILSEQDRTLLDALTEREKQVLRLVAQGMSSARIADELDISPKTVSRHRERIMGKLNLHTAADLVRFAVRVGLVSP